jgi:hypothetical protein
MRFPRSDEHACRPFSTTVDGLMGSETVDGKGCVGVRDMEEVPCIRQLYMVRSMS